MLHKNTEGYTLPGVAIVKGGQTYTGDDPSRAAGQYPGAALGVGSPLAPSAGAVAWPPAVLGCWAAGTYMQVQHGHGAWLRGLSVRTAEPEGAARHNMAIVPIIWSCLLVSSSPFRHLY